MGSAGAKVSFRSIRRRFSQRRKLPVKQIEEEHVVLGEPSLVVDSTVHHVTKPNEFPGEALHLPQTAPVRFVEEVVSDDDQDLDHACDCANDDRRNLDETVDGFISSDDSLIENSSSGEVLDDKNDETCEEGHVEHTEGRIGCGSDDEQMISPSRQEIDKDDSSNSSLHSRTLNNDDVKAIQALEEAQETASAAVETIYEKKTEACSSEWDVAMSETWEVETAREAVRKSAKRLKEMFRRRNMSHTRILLAEVRRQSLVAYGHIVAQSLNEKMVRGLDECDIHGDTPLHRAAYVAAASKDHIHATTAIGRLRLLCDLGASLDAKNMYGDTALHVAAATASTEATIALLEAGANSEEYNKQGYTPLLVATREAQSSPLLFEALAALSKKPNYLCPHDGMAALHHACVNDAPRIVDILLSVAQCDINVRTVPHGHTPLMKTCIYAAHRCLERLLRTRPQEALDVVAAQLDLKASDSGMTAVHYASRAGDSIALSLLLAAGADPQIRDHASKLAVLYAAHAQSRPCVEVLRAHPSTPHNFDVTPIGRRVERLLGGAKNEDDQLGGSTCFSKYGGCF